MRAFGFPEFRGTFACNASVWKTSLYLSEKETRQRVSFLNKKVALWTVHSGVCSLQTENKAVDKDLIPQSSSFFYPRTLSIRHPSVVSNFDRTCPGCRFFEVIGTAFVEPRLSLLGQSIDSHWPTNTLIGEFGKSAAKMQPMRLFSRALAIATLFSQERLMHFPTWVDLKGEDSVPETVHHVVSHVSDSDDGLPGGCIRCRCVLECLHATSKLWEGISRFKNVATLRLKYRVSPLPSKGIYGIFFHRQNELCVAKCSFSAQT